MSANGFGNISIMTRSLAWAIICFLVLPITVVFALYPGWTTIVSVAS